MRYESWKAEVRRAAQPLGLVLKAGHWYLVARVGKDLRTYRVSKILKVDASEEVFERPADFDLARHWQGEVARFESSLRVEKATLLVMPEAMSSIDRLGADAAEALFAAVPDGDGLRHGRIPIDNLGIAVTLPL